MDGPIRQLAFCRPVSIGEQARGGVVTMIGIRLGVSVGVDVFVDVSVLVTIAGRVAVRLGVFVTARAPPVTGMNGRLPALAIRTYPLTAITAPMMVIFNKNLRALRRVEGLPFGLSGGSWLPPLPGGGTSRSRLCWV